MKRTTKRYVVTSSALNCYGYRVLTEGIDLTQFLKNPVLLWMHKMDTSPSPYDKTIPLGRAVDVKREGDEITCALEFSESNPFAMIIYGMYEDETLNMLSLGAKPLAWSEEPEHMLEGQIGLTFTKSKAVEFTCCDVGANDDALGIQLYDADDNPINLTNLDFEATLRLFQSLQQIKKEDTDNMKLIQLTGPALNGILLALKLEDAATEVEVQKAVSDMVQKNITLSGQIDTLTDAKTKAENELVKLQGEQKDANIIALVDGHKNKYLPGQRERLIRLAKANFEDTKEYLEGLPALQSVQEKLTLAAGETTELEGLIKLSWDDLHTNGKLERLKELDSDAFMVKRNEKWPVAAKKK